MRYLYINKYKIQPYNGEILKRVVDNKLVKTISNPKDEDLEEFGYLELVDSGEPSYDIDTQELVVTYELAEDRKSINKIYSITDIEEITDAE